MPNTPKISVVVPCFNAEPYIAATVRSALAQDWPDLEVIVVDDGSTDRSAQVVADLFPGVVLVKQPNRGVAAARNAGIEHSSGEWIAFLDADDIWLPGKLQAQWRALCDDSTARMAYGAWQVWPSAEASPTPEYVRDLLADSHDNDKWAGPSGWIYSELLLDCEVWTSTVLARRDLFAEIGNFDQGLRIGEDYDLWLRASRVTPILRVSRPLALYRMHAVSITRSVPETNFRELVVSRALGRWGYRSPQGANARRSDVHRAIARSWSDFASAHLDAGNLARARHGGLMSLRSHPLHGGGWKVFAKSLARSVGLTRPAVSR